jgi:hypothetical protein
MGGGVCGRRDETCPFSTEGGTRRVQLVRGGGVGGAAGRDGAGQAIPPVKTGQNWSKLVKSGAGGACLEQQPDQPALRPAEGLHAGDGTRRV